MRGHREHLDAWVAPIPTLFVTLVLSSMLIVLWKPIWHSHVSWIPISSLCSHWHCAWHWIIQLKRLQPLWLVEWQLRLLTRIYDIDRKQSSKTPESRGMVVELPPWVKVALPVTRWSIRPVGTRILDPTLLSPDVVDDLSQDSILVCELGRCARSHGPPQQKDVNCLVWGEPNSLATDTDLAQGFMHTICPFWYLFDYRKWLFFRYKRTAPIIFAPIFFFRSAILSSWPSSWSLPILIYLVGTRLTTNKIVLHHRKNCGRK